MRGEDGGNFGLQGKNGTQRLAMFKAASMAVRAIFGLFTRAIGLQDYHLADMDHIATISHQYYDNHLRGGEGHMEVGKLMQTVEHRKAHMVISVKPFGCMPSSGVSDGVQSLITSRFPEAIFTAIETTGDGEVNVQSRIQMDLFKAKKRAEAEYATAVARTGLTSTAIETKARRKARALHHPPHVVAGTAANQVLELAGIRQWSA
jgi:predicted nucleotide-binding protein (sugar kinase/HSP70/actin superfamily)